MERRTRVPDVAAIADQLIDDYIYNTDGDLDAIGTLASWGQPVMSDATTG
jgi:hypothetical protein